jgi:hypothetical protein
MHSQDFKVCSRRLASIARIALLILGWTGVIAAAGCGTSQRLTLESVSGYTQLTVTYPTSVFTTSDAATGDFYLTDLPPELWRPDADLTGASGTLVHLHMFLPPAAGRAPMGVSASNLTIRYIIISNGEVGVYAGGGFLYLKGLLKSTTAGGNFTNASMCLVRASDNFRDLLGASLLTGSFRASKQDGTAVVLAAKVRQIMEMAKKVE